ncbi:helix-turn-helix domain-containing protein [Pseudomonas sp. LB3P25]
MRPMSDKTMPSTYTPTIDEFLFTHFKHSIEASDPVIYHLACAVIPMLNQPDEANRFFIDQIMMAMQAHLSLHQGQRSVAVSSKDRGLAPWQQRRAKEMLCAHIADGVSVEKLARECSFSRCHFSRAFKLSLGSSPHQYLLQLRVDKAKKLLLNPLLKITDVAIDCGFSDSSHFTKVFSRCTGFSPSYWRQLNTGFR